MNPRLSSTEQTLRQNIGEAILQIRLARRVSIAVLAKNVGISKGFLSKIERGEKAPAISTLINIANALYTGVSSILEAGRQEQRISFVKKNDRPEAVRYASAFGYNYAALAHKMDQKHMEPFLITFPRFPRRRGAGFRHPGEEFLIVLRGRIRFKVGNGEYVLEPGDALYFDSSIPHWGRSIAQKDSEVLDIIFVPLAQ